MNLGRVRVVAPLAAAALLLLAACNETGETVDERRAIALDGATSAEVRLELGAGRLQVTPDGSGLADARFRYNVADWEPEVDYTVHDGTGELRIEQGEGGLGIDLFDLDDVTNRWDVALNPDVPTALDIEIGAGDSEIDLRGMTLTELDISTGAGEVSVDLAGEWERDLDVRIEAGAGRLTVRLPKDVGVRIEVDRGLTDIDRSGLTRDGDGWTNAAWDTSDVALTLHVEQGAGELDLEVVE